MTTTESTVRHVEVRWAVIDRTMQWWMGKRPTSMTHEQHLENPKINCVGKGEQELAEAIADYMKAD